MLKACSGSYPCESTPKLHLHLHMTSFSSAGMSVNVNVGCAALTTNNSDFFYVCTINFKCRTIVFISGVFVQLDYTLIVSDYCYI